MKFALLVLLLAVATGAHAQGDWVSFGPQMNDGSSNIYRKSSIERLGDKAKIDIKMSSPRLEKIGAQYVELTLIFDCQKMTYREDNGWFRGRDGKLNIYPVDKREREVLSNPSYKELALIACEQKPATQEKKKKK